MPHFIVEYSGNLETAADISGLLKVIHKAAIGTGVFPLKGTRTRAARRDLFEIADQHPDNGFVHVCARIGQGRDPGLKKRAAETIFDAVCEFLKPYCDNHPLAISFEMQEIDAETSFKFNNLSAWISKRENL